jgi:hypothetical protein
MLNELNKNHMGGFDNYGAEDAYNLEDTWDERRQHEVKPKVRKFFLLKREQQFLKENLFFLANGTSTRKSAKHLRQLEVATHSALSGR